MFGRATITLGIGPHSSYFLTHSVFLGLLFTAFVKEVVLSFCHFVRSRGSISVNFFFGGGSRREDMIWTGSIFRSEYYSNPNLGILTDACELHVGLYTSLGGARFRAV